jgi:hypothetical protein
MRLKVVLLFVSRLANQKTAASLCNTKLAITDFFRTVNTESNRQKVKY